jgi:hypothetical protein
LFAILQRLHRRSPTAHLALMCKFIIAVLRNGLVQENMFRAWHVIFDLQARRQ